MFQDGQTFLFISDMNFCLYFSFNRNEKFVVPLLKNNNIENARKAKSMNRLFQGNKVVVAITIIDDCSSIRTSNMNFYIRCVTKKKFNKKSQIQLIKKNAFLIVEH